MVRGYGQAPGVCWCSWSCLAAPAAAQTADVVGVRALGMGGAFTAVADDATGSWWNPAGIAGGAYVNALIESGSQRDPAADRTAAGDPTSAWRANTRSLAIAYPALGLSYYRLRVSEIQPLSSTGSSAAVRQDGGADGGPVYVRRSSTSSGYRSASRSDRIWWSRAR